MDTKQPARQSHRAWGASIPRSSLLFGGIWLSLMIYAFGFAPPNQPDTLNLIVHLSLGQWQGINPWIIALFNAMGIWPLVYAAVLLADGRGQRVRAWPFAIAATAVGAFAILPYLALRTPERAWEGNPNRVLRFWDSRWLGGIACIGAIACWLVGITQGDWAGFVGQWQSDRFIHVMGLDFCLLTLLFPVLLPDDLRRRGMIGRWPWILLTLPLVGATFYVLFRKNLPSVPQTHG